MIVSYLDRIRIAVTPLKANAPLVIDSNAVLARALAFKLFQAVAWRDPQVLQAVGRIKHKKLSQRTSKSATAVFAAAVL